MEKNYDFRKRHWAVHKPGRQNPERTVKADEIAIGNDWRIGGIGGVVTENAVKDFQDYLWVSMDVSVKRCGEDGDRTIWITVDETVDRGFVIEACPKGILVRLSKDKEAFRAVVHMEDLMNLEQAPVLPMGKTVRRPLYDTRSVHSACGLDDYPDTELRATVHAGYDTIVLFVKGFDQTTKGHCDINDIIKRAANFGIGVQLYNYMASFVHPDDPGAQKVFDATYGELFRRYPDAISLRLTGESLEFPSKDPHTTGKKHTESYQDGIPDTRPSPGWYPCYDYPAYLSCIERAVHSVKPDAEIVYSTYNWSYQPAELREEFLKKLPKGFKVSICYEIQAEGDVEGLRTSVMDYTISQDTPGKYYLSEAAICKKLGIPVQGNVNTSGIAWDFGCVPLVPAPYKLLNRMRTLRESVALHGDRDHYAGHHYGWWNSLAADLGKWSAWEDFEPDYEELLHKIAERDYGAAAEGVMQAWKLWDKAMHYYIASNEDQYGPWRVGVAYPFIFHPNITRTLHGKEIQFPTDPHAYMGHNIIKTLYQPFEVAEQAPGFLRFPAEIRSLEKMEALWKQGVEAIACAAEPGSELERTQALGRFILCQIRTVIHIKQWWLANTRMINCESRADALKCLDEIEAIAYAEMENARKVIPAVEVDSRLGWEPSMEYVCDRWHIEWKLRQVESALREIAAYRQILEHAYIGE